MPLSKILYTRAADVCGPLLVIHTDVDLDVCVCLVHNLMIEGNTGSYLFILDNRALYAWSSEAILPSTQMSQCLLTLEALKYFVYKPIDQRFFFQLEILINVIANVLVMCLPCLRPL